LRAVEGAGAGRGANERAVWRDVQRIGLVLPILRWRDARVSAGGLRDANHDARRRLTRLWCCDDERLRGEAQPSGQALAQRAKLGGVVDRDPRRRVDDEGVPAAGVLRERTWPRNEGMRHWRPCEGVRGRACGCRACCTGADALHVAPAVMAAAHRSHRCRCEDQSSGAHGVTIACRPRRPSSAVGPIRQVRRRCRGGGCAASRSPRDCRWFRRDRERGTAPAGARPSHRATLLLVER
jgi:hypothetical protein